VAIRLWLQLFLTSQASGRAGVNVPALSPLCPAILLRALVLISKSKGVATPS